MADLKLEFNTDDVTIAADGKVIINNPVFAKNLVEQIKTLAPDKVGIFDNCDCKKQPSREIRLRDVIAATSFKFDPGLVGIFDNCSCKGKDVITEDIHR